MEELRDYVATIGQDQEKDPTFQDDLSPAFIEKIMMKNKEVNQHQKDEGRSQRFSTLVVIDDFAHRQDVLHKNGSIIDRPYMTGRHFGISTIVSSQKIKALSSAIRMNPNGIFLFRLRANSDLIDGFLKEFGALFPEKGGEKTLLEIYKRATAKDHGFLYINLNARDKNQMFFNGLDFRFTFGDDEENSQEE